MSQPSADTPISGDTAVLARRYAGAFYDLAEEQQQIDAVANDMRGLRQLLAESKEFQTIAQQPRLTRAQLVSAVKSVTEAAKLSPLTGNFLALIAQNRRLNNLDAIIGSFLSQLAAQRGEYTADVYAAKALTPAQQEQLSSKLRELAGGKVHLSVREDKSLLGGFVVKLGSRLIDASVKNKLARIERQLKTNMDTQKGAA